MMQVYVKDSAEAVQLYLKAFDVKMISENKNGMRFITYKF
jgi:hypothetical protein